jgi:hypothetical protein
VAPENTLAESVRLLKKGKTPAGIAKEREMAVSTIWTHLEKAVDDGLITVSDLEHLTHDAEWQTAHAPLMAAIAEYGDEKLKPLYEATGEQYSYDLVRLARMLYRAKRSVGT